MSPLGFKARLGSHIRTLWKCMWYTFPEIHLWCDTSAGVYSHHSSQLLSPHACFSRGRMRDFNQTSCLAGRWANHSATVTRLESTYLSLCFCSECYSHLWWHTCWSLSPELSSLACCIGCVYLWWLVNPTGWLPVHSVHSLLPYQVCVGTTLLL